MRELGSKLTETPSMRVVTNAPTTRMQRKRKMAGDLAEDFINGFHNVSVKLLGSPDPYLKYLCNPCAPFSLILSSKQKKPPFFFRFLCFV